MAVLPIEKEETKEKAKVHGGAITRFISPSGEKFPTGDESTDRPEPMTDLQGELWFGDQTTIGVADKMDLYPIVSAVNASIVLPISQSEFTFFPTDEKSELSVEIAEAIQDHFTKDALLARIM
jgi:hypothetical protein